MRALTAWLKATVQYNPTFPISALLLMGGVYRLLGPSAGATDVRHVAATAGVIAGYELVLVALALFVLWPRRVVYETTSALLIDAVLRFAPAVTVLLLDPRENLGFMLLLGGVSTAFVVARMEASARVVGIASRPWERIHSAGVTALVSLGVPCFARVLLTAGALSRPGAFGGVLVLTLVLAPGFLLLGRRRPDGAAPLERPGPLGSRLPVVVSRLLEATSVIALTLVAFWLNDVRFEPATLVPFVFLALLAAVSAAAATSPSGMPRALLSLLPAPGAIALLLVTFAEGLAGRTFSPAWLLLGTLPLALGLAVHFARQFPGAHARLGERAALLAAAAAPLRALPTSAAAGYVLALAGCAVVFGLVRRHERLTVAGLLGSAVNLAWLWTSLGKHAVFDGSQTTTNAMIVGVLTLAPLLGTTLALVGALRFDAAGIAARLGSRLVLAAAIGRAAVAYDSPGLSTATVLMATVAGLFALGVVWKRARGTRRGLAFGADLALLVAEPVRALAFGLVATLGDGVVLVGLAFVALPVGVLVGIKRERLLSSLDAR